MEDERRYSGARSDRRDERWHLNKGVSLAHIGSTLLLAGSIFAYALSQDQRITRLEERQAASELRINRQEERIISDLREIKATQVRIEDRIHRGLNRQD